MLPLLGRYEDTLPELFNVSQVELSEIGLNEKLYYETNRDIVDVVFEQDSRTTSEAIRLTAEVAPGSKCERCWRVVPDVGADNRWPSVCSRCAEALDAINFPPTQEAA